MDLVVRLVAGIALASFALACSPDKVIQGATTGSTAAPVAVAPDAGGVVVAQAVPAPVEFAENDFTESDRNRDPFRTYIIAIAPERKIATCGVE